MKKLTLFVLTLLAAVTIVRAADVATVAVEGGYTTAYVVNGVTYATDTPYAGIGAVKSLKYADVYVSGLLLANGSQDQSHWLLGLGRNLPVSTNISFRADATVLRHQTVSSGIGNSTEAGAKLAIANPWITPYVRGAFNFELNQNGYFVGAERAQKLFLGLVLTPAVEWGKMTDYEALNAKATLTRPFAYKWGTVTPYAEVAWYDNGNWQTTTKAFALKQFENDLVYCAGLRLTF